MGSPFVDHVTNSPTTWSDLSRESSFFFALNRNKKSVIFNLKSTEGRALAKRLANNVLVENVSRGPICSADILGFCLENIVHHWKISEIWM
jgi:crotonobetainyl-CoA:carnitine CoA-transferase CaiB-like acyl-CoA transferase